MAKLICGWMACRFNKSVLIKKPGECLCKNEVRLDYMDENHVLRDKCKHDCELFEDMNFEALRCKNFEKGKSQE